MSPSLLSLGRRKQSLQKRASRSRFQSSSRTAPTTTATTRTTATERTAVKSKRAMGPYDRAFQQHLIDFNILPHGYEYPDGATPPALQNKDDVLRVLSQDRASLSPSKCTGEHFVAFEKANTQVSKESDVMASVIPIIEGNIGDRKCAASDVSFTNLDPLTDGTLVPGKPDRYYGARPEQLRRDIRVALEDQIIPSSQHDLPIAPNFFLQVKGPDGTHRVAMQQACYDAALGARGMHSLRAYAGDAGDVLLDNKAYTLTSTFMMGQLTMYASQPIPPTGPGGLPGYALTQLGAFSLTGGEGAFRQGVAAYRNGRDWAKRTRDEIIRQANETPREHAAATSQDTDGDSSELDGH